MKIAIITGYAGLVGSETVRLLSKKGFKCVGIDNDSRKYFFGKNASTKWNANQLKEEINDLNTYSVDIRDFTNIKNIFKEYNSDIKLIIHTAAQPSHDWAAKEPITDFTINANGTLNLLEATRKYSPRAIFIFTSTNKVYGDTPNNLPLVETEKRWEISETHSFYKYGIDESMSIDQSKHSLFGCSKVAADVLVQEYGKYFNINTGVFRGGCLTGPNHSGTTLHGFLAYLMDCAINKNQYTIFGYKGKQVRDNIHSEDLVSAFYEFYLKPKQGEVYNIGGSRFSNCSILEAIAICEKITENKMNYKYSNDNRIGDHIWYISDVSKFQNDYPNWKYTKNIKNILSDIFIGIKGRSKCNSL